jgi:hypothetical protein
MASYVQHRETPEVPKFVQYTLTASAAALSGSTLLDDTTPPKKLTIKNANGAANAVYLGGSGVTNVPAAAGIELAANQSYTFEYKSPAHIYIVGTVNAANIAFITAEY